MIRIDINERYDVEEIKKYAIELMGDITYESYCDEDAWNSDTGWMEHFYTMGNEFWQYVFVVTQYPVQEAFDIEALSFRLHHGVQYYDYTFLEFANDADAVAFKLQYL